MTLRQFWELNIKGNAQEQLRRLTYAGDKAANAFHKGQYQVQQMTGQLGRTGTSINHLTRNLRQLREHRDAAFNTRDIRRFNREIAETERRIDRLQRKGRNGFLGGTGNMLRGMAAASMAFGTLYAGQAVGRDYYQRNLNFDKAITKTYAISNANAEERKQLRQTAIDIGGAYPFTATDAAKGLTYYTMAGFDAQQSIAAMPAGSNLSMASDLGLDRTADILSNIMGQFGKQTHEAADVSNAIAATVSSSNTNFEQLSEAFKYLGPTAKSLGMTLEETAAIVGIEGSAGIQGSLAGRALGTSLVNLAKPTSKQQDTMDALGINFYNNGEFIGMAGVLKEVEEATKGMTQEQRNATVSTLFQNEAYQEMQVLLEKGSEQFEQYKQQLTGTQEASRMAAEMTDNLSGDIDRMTSAWEQLMIQIEEGTGVLSKFGRGFTQFVTSNLNRQAVREKYGMDSVLFNPFGNYKDQRTEAEDFYLKNKEFLLQMQGKGGTEEEKLLRADRFLQMLNRYDDDYLKGKYGENEDILAAFQQMRNDLKASATGYFQSVVNSDAVTTKETGEGLDESDKVSDAINGINAGGSRTRNVIVTIEKLIESLNIESKDLPEAVEQSEEILLEGIMRVINGAEQAIITQGE